MDPILRRIARELRAGAGAGAGADADAAADAAALVDRLAALPAPDLRSLLLALIRARAAKTTPSTLVDAAHRDATTAASTVDARVFHAIDGAAFAAAPEFAAIELSPVAPLGLDTLLGGISPNNVLATIRATQLLADPTTALALEATRRRKAPANRAPPHRLATSARLFRLQPLPPGEPHFTPHFRLFALVTAGRDEGSFGFELRSLREQLAVYLRLVAALPALGIDVTAVEIAVSDTDAIRGLLRAAGIDGDELAGLVHGYDADAGAPTLAAHGLTLPRELDPDRDVPDTDADLRAARRRLAAVRRDVFAPLAIDFPAARFRLDGARLAGLGYYRGLTLQIWLTTADGVALPVGDGGFTTWTQTLLGDRKERLLTSGLGVELLAKRYRSA